MFISKEKYKACIYTRLSKDDGDKPESDSIGNQKALIRDFIKNHPEIQVVSEKADDGYSGVNFERPGFKEMMDEIRAGQVDCVIVKDLSRFGSEPKAAEPAVKVPFLVKVSISDLNIRKGSGTDYNRVQFCPVGVYTIVEVKSGKGASAWGRLKSGIGWISLEFVKRV